MLLLLFIFLLFFNKIECFKINQYRKDFIKLQNNDNNKNHINYENIKINNIDKKDKKNFPKVFNVNLNSIIENYNENDFQYIYNYLFNPISEEDIKNDTFESYLREEFYNILHSNLNYDDSFIYFSDFYDWRKNKIGTLWTLNELKDIYHTIICNKESKCNLMNFILLNKIIDENDGADF